MNYRSADLQLPLPFGIYFTVGNDAYWLRNAEKFFKSLVPQDSFSLHIFSKINSFQEVLDAVDTMSFSGDSNVVIVKDSDYKYSDSDKSALKNFSCDQAYLLFINSKLFEKSKEDKKSGSCFTAEEKKIFSAIDCEKSDKFACVASASRLFRYGIEQKAAHLLCDYTNCDMARIVVEGKKLTDYCGERQVTVADVKELVVEDTDLQIFMFVNNIVQEKYSLAKTQLARLKKRGESPALLLASLISQYRRMLYASLSSLEDKELADLFKVKEFAIKKVRENRKLSKKELKNALDMLVGFEYKFKSGVMSEQKAFDAAICGLFAKENL